MCTIAILNEVVDGAPLVIAANRDELYARPTRPVERWASEIIAGVDVQSGGTWFAVAKSARFAAVTNQRALATPPTGVRSRGAVVHTLATTADQEAAIAALDPRAYASMNLVWGEPGRVAITYARHGGGTKETSRLAPGVHVLCNDRLGAPGYPRGDRLAAGIHAALARDARWPAMAEALASLLADHARAPVTILDSPLAPTVEGALTATCIHTELYGTRSATLFAAAPGRVLDYRYADGPPCTAPFVDRMELFDS